MARENLTFDLIGRSARRTQRPINPDRIASDVSFELEKSEGVRPSVAFMPHRFSPTIKTIHTVSNEDFGIAIPKGTIVGAIPVVSEEVYKNGFTAPVSGTPVIESGTSASGEHVVGLDNDDDALYAGSDNPLYGYGKVLNAMVVANGGEIAKDTYSQYDVDSNRLLPDGTAITISDTFKRGANIPLGYAHEDVYINREGQFLNASESKFQLFDAITADYFIAVPYVVSNGTYTPAVTTSADADGDQTQSDAYAAIYNNGVHCLIASALGDVFTIGNAVKSDLNGKFKPQFTETGIEASDPIGSGQYLNLQTVGKIFAVDTKFPKDLENTVQTYPNNTSGGTAIWGLPFDLYRLIYYVFTANGTTINYTNVFNALHSGDFGLVYINIHTN